MVCACRSFPDMKPNPQQLQRLFRLAVTAFLERRAVLWFPGYRPGNSVRP